MGKIDETRRKNARQLATSAGGPAKFARKTGLSDSRVSQIIGENFTRNIGNKTATLIEISFEKADGWLDSDNDYSEIRNSNGASGEKDALQNIRLVYLTDDEQEIISNFREADERSKTLIITVAKNAVKDEKKLFGILKPNS